LITINITFCQLANKTPTTAECIVFVGKRQGLSSLTLEKHLLSQLIFLISY